MEWKKDYKVFSIEFYDKDNLINIFNEEVQLKLKFFEFYC